MTKMYIKRGAPVDKKVIYAEYDRTTYCIAAELSQIFITVQ